MWSTMSGGEKGVDSCESVCLSTTSASCGPCGKCCGPKTTNIYRAKVMYSSLGVIVYVS